MTLSLPVRVALLAAAVSAWGCGSCQPSGESSPAKPAANAVAPTAPLAAPPADEATDCFVIVDAEPDFGAPPLAVHFTTETECTGSPVTYSWDFGDGSTGGNEATPSHTYDKPGDYIATVTAKSPDGGEGSDEIDITVDENFDE